MSSERHCQKGLGSLIDVMRNDARKGKNFKESDRIRDELARWASR